MIDQSQINQSILKSINLRKIIVQIAKEAGDKAAHIGGALSCIDFLSAADEVYKISDSHISLNSLVLSKGHACLALYSLMADSGIRMSPQLMHEPTEDFRERGGVRHDEL